MWLASAPASWEGAGCGRETPGLSIVDGAARLPRHARHPHAFIIARAVYFQPFPNQVCGTHIAKPIRQNCAGAMLEALRASRASTPGPPIVTLRVSRASTPGTPNAQCDRRGFQLPDFRSMKCTGFNSRTFWLREPRTRDLNSGTAMPDHSVES